ncbi:MAG: pentapeptide repeat-containing protein, partial [Ktedonobacteraceae bacterium]
MTHSIPPDLLAQIEAHERWLETGKNEGKGLAQGNMDLRDLDLSGRQLVMTALPGIRLDRTLLHGANLSDSNLCGASFVDAVLDGAWLVE